ncbi:hypothetical protein MMYC01_206264 [Madurella mycetomatis]|uniref:Uncharacterized protein n=1 Tax=Madurella mycetomatis TaxID=100816 RepID=A0A175VXR8_9PEZI|nr:hypothetical protein MMYC01_206264 [Madurella mycetomatis]
MESSPLTKAHDHARAAAIATHTSDTPVAIAEHAQAAGEFANASKSTSSVEALRTLRLLEQHHRRLSELLKLPVGPPSHAGVENDIPEEDEKEASEQDGSKTTSSPGGPPAAKQTAQAKPLPTLSHQRYPGRNPSSSIASNLASARGIRARYSALPLTPSVSNDQAPGSLEVHPRREGSVRSKGPDPLDQARKPSWVPPAIKEDTVGEPPKSSNPEPGGPTPGEDGFSRFYSTFGSLINRLSAPLAFAGLPLIAEESTPEASAAPPPDPAPRRPRHRPSSSSADPDLAKIYSRATLNSLARDGQGPNDSFYVVPTSGHTASYASILNHENKEKRRIAASLHRGDYHDDNEDDDDFVDARESQVPVQPLSPTLRKRLGSRSSRSDKDLRNMLEELQLENASLKDVLDKVSKRLHSFELNSQTSHLALAQSLRLQRPGGGGGGGGGGQVPGGGEALRRRNRELEEQLAEMGRRMAELERDHVKLQQTVEKYRERWEKLKAGAKARREAQEQANDGEGSRK